MNRPSQTTVQRLIPLALAATAALVALICILLVGGAILGAGAELALVVFGLCLAGFCAWALWRVRKQRGA